MNRTPPATYTGLLRRGMEQADMLRRFAGQGAKYSRLFDTPDGKRWRVTLERVA